MTNKQNKEKANELHIKTISILTDVQNKYRLDANEFDSLGVLFALKSESNGIKKLQRLNDIELNKFIAWIKYWFFLDLKDENQLPFDIKDRNLFKMLFDNYCIRKSYEEEDKNYWAGRVARGFRFKIRN